MSKQKNTTKIYKKTPFIIGATCLLVAAGLFGTYTIMNINEAPSVQVEQKADIAIPPAATSTNNQTAEITRIGEFVDGDAVHSGSGSVQVFDNSDGPILVFGDDFRVTDGPDLFVYLSPNMANEPLGEFASLGELKSNSGEQAYNLPENYDEYKSVVIWCRAFGVTFATAEIKPAEQ